MPKIKITIKGLKIEFDGDPQVLRAMLVTMVECLTPPPKKSDTMSRFKPIDRPRFGSFRVFG